jgi:BirA family transcriptional regulator, biotin operon repressor / biotin---[acetyl-CoA-carboxylase] ligase
VPRRHYRLTDSTNERARELAEGGAPGGTVVTADEQSAGRGRHGRQWAAPVGKALLVSAILRPLEAGHALLPLAVPLAVSEAIEAVAPVRCGIKWPNDVWIDERKVSGVLIEGRPQQGWAVIGVGVNVSIEADEFPAELRWPATSVGHGATVGAVFAALCEQLGEWVETEQERVLTEFSERDVLRDRQIRWVGAGDGGDGSGVADGIDERGNLVVRTSAGERISLGSGEIELLDVD